MGVVSTTRKRLTQVTVVAGLATLAAAVVVAGLTWYRDPPITVVGVAVRPGRQVYIGAGIRYTATVAAPWYRMPIGPLLPVLPHGLQTVDKGRIRLTGISGAGVCTWACHVTVQPYELGPFEDARLPLHFPPDRHGKPARVEIDLGRTDVEARPGARLAPLVAAGPLAPGAVSPAPAWSCGLHATIALVVVAAASAGAALRLWYRRPRRPPQRSAWERADRELNDLSRLAPVSAELFFGRLVDLLARYLEIRFGLPATQRTSPELLSTVRSTAAVGGSALQTLAEVLAAAEMAKFARLEATAEQMHNALTAARRFLMATVP
jgi:hypothetical protein